MNREFIPNLVTVNKTTSYKHLNFYWESNMELDESWCGGMRFKTVLRSYYTHLVNSLGLCTYTFEYRLLHWCQMLHLSVTLRISGVLNRGGTEKPTRRKFPRNWLKTDAKKSSPPSWVWLATRRWSSQASPGFTLGAREDPTLEVFQWMERNGRWVLWLNQFPTLQHMMRRSNPF